MQIVLRLIEGEELKLDINEDTTVEKIKEIVREKIPLEGELNLIFKGRILENNEILNKIPGIEGTFVIIHNKKPKHRFGSDFLSFGPADLMHDQYFTTLFNIVAGQDASNDPPNFQELVTNLTEMGFEKADCERALRLSGYVPDTAVSILLSGNIQNMRRLPHMFHEMSSDQSSDNENIDGLEYDEEEEDMDEETYIRHLNDAMLDDMFFDEIDTEEEEEEMYSEMGEDGNTSITDANGGTTDPNPSNEQTPPQPDS